MQTHRGDPGKKAGEEKNRDGCYAATSQGKPRTASNHQKPEETNNDCPSETVRESKALLTPWFWTSSLQNSESISFSVLSLPV